MATKQFYVRFGTGNPAASTGLSPTFIVFRSPSGATTPPSITELPSTGIYTFAYECTGSVAFVVDGATTGLTSADRYVCGAIDITTRLDEFTGRAGDAVGFSSLYGQILSGNAQGSTLTARLGAITDETGFSTVFGQLGSVSAQGSTLTDRVGSVTDGAGFSTLFGQIQASSVATLSTQVGSINDVAGFSTLFGQVKQASAIGMSQTALLGSATDTIGDNVTDPNTLFGFIRRTNEVFEGQSVYEKASGVLTLKDKTGATTLSSRTIADTGSQVTKT